MPCTSSTSSGTWVLPGSPKETATEAGSAASASEKKGTSTHNRVRLNVDMQQSFVRGLGRKGIMMQFAVTVQSFGWVAQKAIRGAGSRSRTPKI